LGGLHSADLILRSVDFARIEAWQAEGNWDAAGHYLAECALDLQRAGAEGLVIATNTMHKVADTIIEGSGLELLHIADCTGRTLSNQNIKKVALLGTGFTMEQGFYKDRLIEQFGLEVLIPDENDRKDVHDIIYNELCLGQVLRKSQDRYVEIAEKLFSQGAESIILGCTEIGMLLNTEVTDVPLMDTTKVHAQEAVNWMLSK